MLWETVILAFREIRRNVMRSSLTILGIVIGVAAVITLVTLGRGATAQVAAEIASLGSNMLQIRPGQGFRGPGGASGAAKPFKEKDVTAIAQQIAGIAAVAPLTMRNGQVIAGNVNWSTNITGSTTEYLFVRSWSLAAGRSFTDSELRAGKSVCILGATVKKELFGDQDPLGARVRVSGITCRVIGLFAAKGQSSGGNDQDDFLLMPLQTLQRRIVGNDDISAIFVSARDGVSTAKVREDIEQLLRERRRIGANQADDFFVRDMQEIMSTLTGTTRILTALLGAVAAVSLLVGGIGIMNIMLVSVTERTREIGIRLAIGALEKDVLLQFLVESVVLSSFGGLFGIAFGLGAAALGARAMDMPFIFSPGIVAVAFLFSGGVGVVFGFFPARKAARLDPIDALRHE
ncbi:MAG: multidrug ABC transporter substrate-binding protein [Desulfobacterales bacterium GWB2_56_26]|nr:MAG: multidrug ABC transporter substrate-binding protein [Desulfobacterales bacterium GWB2_56_26]